MMMVGDAGEMLQGWVRGFFQKKKKSECECGWNEDDDDAEDGRHYIEFSIRTSYWTRWQDIQIRISHFQRSLVVDSPSSRLHQHSPSSEPEVVVMDRLVELAALEVLWWRRTLR